MKGLDLMRAELTPLGYSERAGKGHVVIFQRGDHMLRCSATGGDHTVLHLIREAKRRCGIKEDTGKRKGSKAPKRNAAAERERIAHDKAIERILTEREQAEAERVEDVRLRKFEARVMESETQRRRWERMMTEVPASREHSGEGRARHRS